MKVIIVLRTTVVFISK